MIRIHDRLVLRLVLQALLFAALGWVILWVLIDLFEKIDNFAAFLRLLVTWNFQISRFSPIGTK